MLIVADMNYEMLMSVCFTCLCNSTHRVALAISIGSLRTNWSMITYVAAEVMPASVFAASYTAELQDRAPFQTQSAIRFWLDRESSYIKRLSQLALDLVASPSCLSNLCMLR